MMAARGAYGCPSSLNVASVARSLIGGNTRVPGLVEPVQQQRQGQHAASLWPLDGHQRPLGLAQVADGAVGVCLGRGVDDAQGGCRILAEH